MRLSRVAFSLLPFVGLVAPQDCKLPVWTVSNVKTSAKDQVGGSGSLTFNLADSTTGKSDALKCSLVANYRCKITGTPSDKNAVIDMQIQMDVLYTSIQTTLACGKKVVGNADLELKCDAVVRGNVACSMDTGEVKAQLIT